MIDPRITAQDLDMDIATLIGASDFGGLGVNVRARANFLTVEIGEQGARGEAAADPMILWLPLTSVLGAISNVNQKVGV